MSARPPRRPHNGPRPVAELEVKARVTDVGALRRALRRAGARLEFKGRMSDRRYDRARELIRRDDVLRLRVYRAGRRGQLPRERFLAESLPYFVAAYRRPTGRKAVLA